MVLRRKMKANNVETEEEERLKEITSVKDSG
jgi:hypothetical protein